MGRREKQRYWSVRWCPRAPGQGAGPTSGGGGWRGEERAGLRLDARFGDSGVGNTEKVHVLRPGAGMEGCPRHTLTRQLASPGATQPLACPRVPSHPGGAGSNLPWVLGIQWGLRCLDLPVEEQGAVAITPALGAGPPVGQDGH